MATPTRSRRSSSKTTKRKMDAHNQRGSTNRCWRGYEPVPDKAAHAKGSCRKASKGVNGSKGSTK